MTIREALGGPWAGQWMLLVALLPPSTLIVLLRESVTPFPEWWWPLVSAVAQHITTAVVILVGTAIARRVHRILPIATALAIWGLGSALRGVVAGAIAQHVAGVDPEFMTRIAVWTLVSLVWVPALVYVIAQLEHRRVIIGALDMTGLDLDREISRADATGAEVQQRLRNAIAESLSPALRDLQASLEANRRSLDRASVAELSLRLSQLHDDTANLLDLTHPPQASPAPHRATLRRAFDVPPRRPWLVAALVAIATCTLIAFDAGRIFGPLAAIEVVISTLAASFVIGAVPAIDAVVRPHAKLTGGQRTTPVAASLSVLVAVVLMLNSGIDPITWHGLLIVPLLAIGLIGASAIYLSAIVLADANVGAATRLLRLQQELVAVRERNEHLVDDERQRLSQLMHGPVQGRIAACIMALNFHASTGIDADTRNGDDANATAAAGRREANDLTDSVLTHLRAASRDLAQITAGEGRVSP